MDSSLRLIDRLAKREEAPGNLHIVLNIAGSNIAAEKATAVEEDAYPLLTCRESLADIALFGIDPR